jgi:predicted nucleotide-binding protein (sugar kinase/HSP70/actin superfamily)
MSLLLESLGVDDLNVLSPASDGLWQLLGFRGLKSLWSGLVATDLLIKAVCEIRPYEVRAAKTDAAHRKNLLDIQDGLAKGTILGALKRCAERLKSIERQKGKRLKIGVVGDIYTRINPSANQDLFRKLESLGCEVWPASFFVEDVDFRFRKELEQKMKSFRLHEGAAAGFFVLRKELERWKVRRALGETVKGSREPAFEDIGRWISSYIGFENNETLLLNIARMADFARKGADGIVNAICFNCMLGTVSAALAHRVRKDFANIPIPTLICSGTESVQERTRLEAFVYKVRQFAARRR